MCCMQHKRCITSTSHATSPGKVNDLKDLVLQRYFVVVWATISKLPVSCVSVHGSIPHCERQTGSGILCLGWFLIDKRIDRCRLYASMLHATQKSRNASVACNAYSLDGHQPAHCPPRLKFLLYRHNMEWVISFAFPAHILIIPKHV
jgi:hypothetical protein